MEQVRRKANHITYPPQLVLSFNYIGYSTHESLR